MAAEVGNLFVSLGLSTGAFDKGVQNVTRKLDQFGRRVKDAGSSFADFGKKLGNVQWGSFSGGIDRATKSLGGFHTAVTAAVGALGVQQIGSWVKAMADAGEATVNNAELLGTSVEKMAELEAMFTLTEGSVEAGRASIIKFGTAIREAIQDPTSEAGRAFAVFNLGVKELTPVANDAAAALKVFADAQAKTANDFNKTTAMRVIFSKGMAELRPLLSGVAQDFDGLRAQVARLDPDGAKFATTANSIASQLDALNLMLVGVGHTLFNQFSPNISTAVSNLETMRTTIISVVNAGAGLVRFIGEIGKIQAKIDAEARAQGKVTRDWIDKARVFFGGKPKADALEEIELKDAPIVTLMEPTLAPTPMMAAAPKKGGGGGGKEATPESRVSAWQDELEQKLIAERKFFGNSNQMELDFWKEKLTLAEVNSKEWLAVRRKIFDLEKSLAQDAQRDAIKQLDHEQQINDARLERRKLDIQQAVDFDKMTETEGAVAYQDVLDQKWEADAAYYQKKIAAAAGDDETQKTLYQQQLLDYENYLTERQRLQGNTLKIGYDKLKTQIEGVADVFKTSLGDAFDKVVEGTFKVKNAIGSLLKDLGKFMANEAFKSLWKIGGTALTSSLGGMFGSTPAAAGTSNMSDLGFPGKQHGGSFRVGGSGGIDSKLVAFRASPGETVNVQSPLGKGGGGEVVRIELNPSEGWVSGIADQQIRTRSGQIVQVAVRQSQSATKRQFNTLSTESAARQA